MDPHAAAAPAHAASLARLAAASPGERAAIVLDLLRGLTPDRRLVLSAAGDACAVLDDAALPGARMPSADLAGAKARRADLRRAVLDGADLRGADLGGARLARAVLATADLGGAELAATDLTGADLSKANLAKALCEEARFAGAKLRFADLRGAACEQAKFPRADLWGADLTGAECGRADFRRAVLTEATARDADFRGADLRGADLTRADLRGADLTRADLRGAHVVGADLRGANLQHARLDGLDLTAVALDGVRLAGARLDGTRLEWHQFGERLGEEEAGDAEGARGGYLALERVFTALGDTAAASWAYLRRRRMQKRLAWSVARLRWAQGRRWAGVKAAGAAAGDQGVEWLCDYGESVGRVLASLAAVFLAFAVLYGVTGSVVRVGPGPDGAEVRQVTAAPADLAIFSLLALTTSGSPVVTLQPRDEFVHFLTGVQALFGISLTGLLGFVVGNRIRR